MSTFLREKSRLERNTLPVRQDGWMVTVFASKPEGLKAIPRTYTVEAQNQLLGVVLYRTTEAYMCTPPPKK